MAGSCEFFSFSGLLWGRVCAQSHEGSALEHEVSSSL